MAENGFNAEQLAAAVAMAAASLREAERREKEGAGDKVSIPKLKHNPEREDTAVRPWPGSPYSIPRDVVELFKRGHQPPLIWLTVEGILDSGRRRQQLTFPLDKKGQEEVNEALARDALLQRAACLGALGALAALFRAFQNVEEVAEDEQDPATLVDELSLAITARAADEHWGLWRRYVRNVLAKIWEPRRDDELDFNVGKIDANLLRLTEEAASVPQGRADDHSNDGKNFVTYLLTAKREDAEAAAVQYEMNLKSLHFGNFGTGSAPPSEPAARFPAQPAGPPSFKRKAREGPASLQPFRAAPSSGAPRNDGAAAQMTCFSGAAAGGLERLQDRFCTACLRPNAGHDFRSCPKAHTDRLKCIPPHGWRWENKGLCFCNRFNLGIECLSPGDKCSFGHYCSRCGKDGCRATACSEERSG